MGNSKIETDTDSEFGIMFLYLYGFTSLYSFSKELGFPHNYPNRKSLISQRCKDQYKAFRGGYLVLVASGFVWTTQLNVI